jgi:DNA-3-methyladenine glycosylase
LTRRSLERALATAITAAPALLGCVLARRSAAGLRLARIVETEAYPPDDPACHAFRGPTRRNGAMFGRHGSAYVYRIHRSYCFNVVTGDVGSGEAVLVRAVEPIDGLALMAQARERATAGRRVPDGYEVTNGPGKLCQALDIDLGLNGLDLLSGGADSPLALLPGPRVRTIATTARIGISVAKTAKLRFVIRRSPWASR